MKTGYYEFCLNHGLVYIGVKHSMLDYVDFIADTDITFLQYAEMLECDQVVAYYADSGNADDVLAIDKLSNNA